MAAPPRPSYPRKGGFSRIGAAARVLIRKPLAKRGFAESRLLTEWDQVVGAEIAGLARPLKLTHAAKEGFGGTLVLGVLGARAPQAQHLEPRILERVNAHYGYRAVARIRLVQVGPEAFREAQRRRRESEPAPEDIARLRTAVAPVADPDLREALSRLGRNIAARQRAGETGKV